MATAVPNTGLVAIAYPFMNDTKEEQAEELVIKNCYMKLFALNSIKDVSFSNKE